MVERPFIKPEVRGAIPRIAKVKDIAHLFNFLQKTTEYWNLIQEIPSQKIYKLLFADWNKSFLDSAKPWVWISIGRVVRGSKPRIYKYNSNSLNGNY